jgi:hypothetical protein
VAGGAKEGGTDLLDNSGVDGVISAGMSSSLAIVLAGVIGIEYGGGVTSSRIGLVNKTLAGSLSGVSKGKVTVDGLLILVLVDGRDESGNEEDCTSSWDSGSLKLALTEFTCEGDSFVWFIHHLSSYIQFYCISTIVFRDFHPVLWNHVHCTSYSTIVLVNSNSTHHVVFNTISTDYAHSRN